jgi:CubicO group peptidase (beta-lactamase class C family)
VLPTYKTILTALFQISFVFLALSQNKTEKAEEFVRIDTLVENAIKSRAFPGASILVFHNDSLWFERTYGYHTYDSVQKVQSHHLYDIASITKIYGATLALMKLYEEGKIDLDQKVRSYVDGFFLNKRGGVTIRELLSHHSGWQSWIRYFEKMRKKDGTWKRRFFRTTYSSDFPVRVADSMFLTRNYYRKIKSWIKRADYNPNQGYVYSGLFFYLVPEIVENLTGSSYEDYLQESFYSKLAMDRTTFNPLSRFADSLIVPTEVDTFFRMEPIHGTVHDEGAILMNGISGNAGLFSTARDLLSLSKVLMNYGIIDGDTLLHPATVSLFTTTQFPAEGNRRALGFDKPLMKYDSVKSSVAEQSSILSFGHTGYTGPLVWLDPEYELIFIFLTNRVYPTRESRGIYEQNVRPRIHKLIYESIGVSVAPELRNDAE